MSWRKIAKILVGNQKWESTVIWIWEHSEVMDSHPAGQKKMSADVVITYICRNGRSSEMWLVVNQMSVNSQVMCQWHSSWPTIGPTAFAVWKPDRGLKPQKIMEMNCSFLANQREEGLGDER